MIQKLDWRTFMDAASDTPEKTIRALDRYFEHFVAVEIEEGADGKREFKSQKCVGCGEILTGLFGTWRWALVHGEGQCGKCGWPSYGHHFIKGEDGKDLVTLRGLILQCHPDFVERRRSMTTTRGAS